ncbi:MAG: ABC transporter permease subunit, partial [Prochlorotrichaceae cyanobacterium]
MTSYLLYLASLVGIYTLFSWGLNLQWGYAGLLNFGHAAFMIVGAYTTVLLNLRGFPLLLAVLGGMLAGAIVG